MKIHLTQKAFFPRCSNHTESLLMAIDKYIKREKLLGTVLGKCIFKCLCKWGLSTIVGDLIATRLEANHNFYIMKQSNFISKKNSMNDLQINFDFPKEIYMIFTSSIPNPHHIRFRSTSKN